MISAKIIADSINPTGDRITTFLLVFPRIVLAEFNTHRMLSRNSASSRAIPFKKMVQLAKTDPFIPLRFQKDHKGMQGTEYFEGEEHQVCVAYWLAARDSAVEMAENMNKFGVTKQLCNRLLEPFMYHTVICTSTDYENFFSLRAHGAAEDHIQHLAHLMLDAYNESNPVPLNVGEWHIPFGENMDMLRIYELNPDKSFENFTKIQRQIATARCARVSFLNFEGKDDYASDIKLYNDLEGPGHFSPFEHCGQANNGEQSGNFKGFTQLRKTMNNENRKDNRVIRKSYGNKNKKSTESTLG